MQVRLNNFKGLVINVEDRGSRPEQNIATNATNAYFDMIIIVNYLITASELTTRSLLSWLLYVERC